MSVTTETLRIINEVVYRGKGEVAKLDRDLKTTSDKAQKLTVNWSDMAAGLGIVGGAAAGLGAAYVKLYQIMGEGAQVQATQLTFDNLALSIGSTSDAMLGDLQEATNGMISDMELMQAANQFTAMGLANTSTEAAKLAEIGSTLGAAFRGDASAGMEEFALLLANQSIPRLDSFGISAGAVRTRIAELQEQTPGLSRETAFMEAVMEQAEITMGKLGDNTDSAAAQMAILESTFEDTKNEAKVMLTEGLLPTVTAMAELVTNTHNAVFSMDDFVGAISTGINQALQPGVDTLEKLNIIVTAIGSNPWYVWFNNGLLGIGDVINETEADIIRLEMALNRGGAGRGGGAVGGFVDLNEEVEDSGLLFEHLRRQVALMANDYDGLQPSLAVATIELEENTEAVNLNANAIQAQREAAAAAIASLGDYATDVQLTKDNTNDAAAAAFAHIDALDASAEATIAAGLALGVYTEAQAEARLQAVILEEKLRMVDDALRDGRLTTEGAIDAYIGLADGTYDSAEEAIFANDRYRELADGGLSDAELGAGDLRDVIGELKTRLLEAKDDADAFAAALRAIPNEIAVQILIEQSGQFTPPDLGGGTVRPDGSNTSATGNVFPHGGYSMVGEFGPEFVRLPAGAQVISTNQTRNITNSTTINGATRRGEQILLQHLRRQSRPATIVG